MIFLNQLCFVYALKLAQASTVALLLGTTPVFIGLTRSSLRLERLQRVVLDRRRADVRRRRARSRRRAAAASPGLGGDLLAIGAAFTWGCYTVAIAPLMRRYSPYRISALVLAIGWLPLALVSIPQLGASTFHFGWKVWLGFALRRDRAALPHEHPLVHRRSTASAPSRASLFNNLQPFFAVLFALVSCCRRRSRRSRSRAAC